MPSSRENAIKAWLSAAGLEYRSVHDLREVADQIPAYPTEAVTLAEARLRLPIDYTSFPKAGHAGGPDSWLALHAVSHRCSGTAIRMDDVDRDRFRAEIDLAVATFIDRAYELTGTSEADLMQGRPNNRPGPCVGFGSLRSDS